MSLQLVSRKHRNAYTCIGLFVILSSACVGAIDSPDEESTTNPLTAATWVSCAKQGAYCDFSATRRVRYADGYTVRIKTFSNGVKCTGKQFGLARSRQATCQYESVPTGTLQAGSPAPAGGAGASGAAGSAAANGGAAGAAGAGSAGTAPPQVSGLLITSELRTDKSSVRAGDSVNATVTYTNTSNVPIQLWSITIAGRAPGSSHAGGPYADFAPSQAAMPLPAGSSVTLDASRTFSATDASGTWETYSTYQDDAGAWHDGPSVFFDVARSACAAESDAAFCARAATSCGAASGTDNCGNSRSVQSCGGCAQGQSCSSGQCSSSTSPTPAPGPAPASSGTMKIGTNFWYHTPNEDNWSGETSMKTGIDWTTAYGSGTNGLATTDVWNATFLSELAPYSTLRFMDWGATNFSKITSWSQRMLPSDARNYSIYIDGSSPDNTPGMAYEWMIDLGNRTHKDIWICLPARADANYATQLATLLKSKLQADRKVYIEYSNETWNGSFEQFQYTIDQGVAQKLPGMNAYYQGQAFAVQQSLKIFKAFQDVFGVAAMGSKVVRVFAYGGNMDTGRSALRSVYQSSTLNPDAQKIDMLAVAPYIGSGLDGASPTIQSDFRRDAELHLATSGEIGTITFAVQDLKTFGIPSLGAYEGGQHLLKNSQRWSANPKIYDEYLYMLDRWSEHFTLFVHYSHTGKWTDATSQSSWGAMDHTGQPISEAHKYRALVDWVSENQ